MRISLLKQLYDAFNRRDVDAVLAALAPDVRWPDMLAGRTLHGREAVREYWTRQFEVIDSNVEPIGFEEDGDRVRVEVAQRVTDLASGEVTEDRVTHTYTFGPDGLVVAMEVG